MPEVTPTPPSKTYTAEEIANLGPANCSWLQEWQSPDPGAAPLVQNASDLDAKTYRRLQANLSAGMPLGEALDATGIAYHRRTDLR